MTERAEMFGFGAIGFIVTGIVVFAILMLGKSCYTTGYDAGYKCAAYQIGCLKGER